MDRERLGAFIAESRKNAGMTQKDLAARLHITDKAVSKWERGLSYPDVTLLEPMAAVFNLSVEELMSCRKRGSAEKEGESVNALLDISRDNLKKERFRSRSRLIGVIGLLLVTVLVIRYADTWISEQRTNSIFLKETVDGENYLYVELKNEGHLLKLKCGPGVDFDAITPVDDRGDHPQYRLNCRWNQKTYTGAVSHCEPTGKISLGGLEDTMFAPDEARIFGIPSVLYAPENYYRNPYGEGYLCDYRFWLTDGAIREGYLNVVEDGSIHYTAGMDNPILMIKDCVNAAVYDWDGDFINEVIVRTRWPEKPYTVYDMVDGEITETWPDTVPDEVQEMLVCIWE